MCECRVAALPAERRSHETEKICNSSQPRKLHLSETAKLLFHLTFCVEMLLAGRLTAGRQTDKVLLLIKFPTY